MKRIPIDKVKEISRQHEGDGAIVLVFDIQRQGFMGTSYGSNKDKCARLAAVLDQISELLIDGKIKLL